MLRDLSDSEAVRQAIAEFDQRGRDEFLSRYGFGPARTYFVRIAGRDYDSKAIAAVAHGFQFPAVGPLTAAEFSGGEATVAAKLRSLGFDVVPHKVAAQNNPDWAVDELILALDLYLTRGAPGNSHPLVIELSELLNRLPIHTVPPDLETFRNPNGVALKLANFLAIDPEHPGGMSQFGRRDKEVWDRFHDHQSELHVLAEALRDGGAGGGPATESEAAATFPAIPEEGEDEVAEGKLLYRRHRTRERDPGMIKRKKAAALKKGPLACEVCGFDFNVAYGQLGDGFIECHHLRPLSATGETRTKLADLALLCANCHRMAHRGSPWPTLGELRQLIGGSA